MSAPRLLVIRQEDEVVPHTPSSCFECRHAWDKGAQYMKCGALGGELCRNLNIHGDCALFVRASRIQVVLRWSLLFMALGSLSVLAIIGLTGAGQLLGDDDGRCRTTWQHLSDSTLTYECEHPDHWLLIEDGQATCRCPNDPNAPQRTLHETNP